MDLNGYSMRIWRLFEDPALPEAEEVDLLVVMGGPMNIYEEDRYPYLNGEKDLIRACIGEHKHVLGICLGAQLISDALGEKVYKNQQKEIGWFPVYKETREDGDGGHDIHSVFPDRFTPFHWHGETFALPQDTYPLGSSRACRNQGFLLGEHVLALQFHLEITGSIVESLLVHAAGDMTPGPYVQSAGEIRSGTKHCLENRTLLFQLLDRFLEPLQKR
jgi:GMP synthase (glutamine-hydrolysing)